MDWVNYFFFCIWLGGMIPAWKYHRASGTNMFWTVLFITAWWVDLGHRVAEWCFRQNT